MPQPVALPADQHRFLALVFDHFSRTGDWPVVPQLQKELARKGERFDLDPVAQQIPRELGYYDFGGRTFSLTVQGVITIAPRSREAMDFETALRLSCELYLNEDKPKLASDMLREREGMNELRLKKLHALLQNAPMLTAGGGRMADGTWEFNVADECHHFLDIKTASDYLATVARIRSEAIVPQFVPPVGRMTDQLRRVVEAVAVPAIQGEHEQLLAVVDGLHPRIRDACRRLVEHGHLTLAVHKAAIALKDLLKERSGLTSDNGDDLANQALSPRSPRIVVADQQTETGRNVQRGVHLLALGVFAAMRNPVAHQDIEFPPGEVLEMLATIGYVARKIAIGTVAAAVAGSDGSSR